MMDLFLKDPTVLSDILKKNYLHSPLFEEIPTDNLENVDELLKEILKNNETIDKDSLLKKEINKTLEKVVLEKDDFTPLISFLALLRKRGQILNSIQEMQKEQSVYSEVSFLILIFLES